MKPSLFLKSWLDQNPAPWKIGEVTIDLQETDHSHYIICHHHDFSKKERPHSLKTITLEDLTTLVKTTDTGEFRPLRASPDLPHGWRLPLDSFDSLLLALQILYPAAIALWSEWSQKTICITSYQDAAARQTGMYRCVQFLNSTQRDQLTLSVCVPGCLKKRLWEPEDPISLQPQEIPLLCAEPCNYFIPKAREVVKKTNR